MYRNGSLLAPHVMYCFRAEILHSDDAMYLRVDALTNIEKPVSYYYLVIKDTVVTIQYEQYTNQYKELHDPYSMNVIWDKTHEVISGYSTDFKVYLLQPRGGHYATEVVNNHYTFWSITKYPDEIVVKILVYTADKVSPKPCITLTLRNAKGMLKERCVVWNPELKQFDIIDKIPSEFLEARDRIKLDEGGYSSTERYITHPFISGRSIDIMNSKLQKLMHMYARTSATKPIMLLLQAPYGFVIRKLLRESEVMYDFEDCYIFTIYVTLIKEKALLHFTFLKKGRVVTVYYMLGKKECSQITYTIHYLLKATTFRHIKYDLQKNTTGIRICCVSAYETPFVTFHPAFGYFVGAVYIGDECIWVFNQNQKTIFDHVKMTETGSDIQVQVYLMNMNDKYILHTTRLIPRKQITVLKYVDDKNKQVKALPNIC
ncbi:hypothetical protein BdWA1_003466 [Babesia duncani]|uniref:Uncharacterized protein n=1 Tax=Babesia duncani TaxID=323732 RepID=A0AAD9PHW4_9APIC|nr:hypothetical protein BdWA1_003466 [Babesia duncani]